MKNIIIFILLIFITACNNSLNTNISENTNETASATNNIYSNKTLKVGIYLYDYPMLYVSNDNINGFDYDIINSIAKEENLKLEFVPIQFSELISALQTNYIDIIIAGMSVTEERKQLVNFSDKYCSSGQGIILNKENDEIKVNNDLVGKTVDEAKQLVQDSKLIYVESSSEYNTTVEAGKIISQDPQYVENRNVKENTEIKVVVSLGTEKTTVPKFIGLTKEEAQNEAKNNKLNLEIVEETSKTVEAGIIISQETEEGTEVNAGDTIKVYVSIGTGIKQVVVTSVYDKDEATAKKILEDAGLVVEVEYEEDTTKTNGNVLKQSIQSGETVDEGTTITITVNKLAETKNGIITINVKSLTGYQDKTTKEEEVLVSGKTEKVETVVDNTPKEVSFRVTVNGDQKTEDGEKVKENVTNYKVEVFGIGRIEIKVVINGKTYGSYYMDLNTTTEMTIDANTKVG